MVKTIIVRMNEEIPVDYFLTAVQERWLIRDVNIDGASIVQNYRKSFSRLIKQESFESLIKKMRLQQSNPLRNLWQDENDVNDHSHYSR